MRKRQWASAPEAEPISVRYLWDATLACSAAGEAPHAPRYSLTVSAEKHSPHWTDALMEGRPSRRSCLPRSLRARGAFGSCLVLGSASSFAPSLQAWARNQGKKICRGARWHRSSPVSTDRFYVSLVFILREGAEERSGGYAVPVVHESFRCRGPLKHRGRSSWKVATDDEDPSTPVRVRDA